METSKQETASDSIGEEWIKDHGLYMYDDMLLMREVDKGNLDKVKSFCFHVDDILIATYPRSGTTWSQEMTWLVCNNADTERAKQTDLNVRSRFIEFTAPYGPSRTPDIDYLENTPPPRVIKTHLPPKFFETQRQAVGFKTIVVMRNLKDVMVSHFHFYQELYDFKASWDDFFEMFKQDQMLYGSWAKHCLKFWQLRDDPTVLILKYEDIKKDHAETIKKIAAFCGKTLSEDQVSAIADFTFFDNMKKRGIILEHPQRDIFIRKGTVGGWKEWFSEEQSEYVAEHLRKTTEKAGLFFE